MKISYESPQGSIELSAYINAETGTPSFILTIFGKSTMLDEAMITLLKQFIPDDIAHSNEIVECKNPTGSSKNLKKNIGIVIKDVIDEFKISDKNSWMYFNTYIVKLFEFLRQIYQAMSTAQQMAPETRKLDLLLKSLGV